MSKETVLFEHLGTSASNSNLITKTEKNKKRISKITKFKGKEILENLIFKNSKTLKKSELLTKQANEFKKSFNSIQSENEDSEPEENLKCKCLCCDKALALKRAKFFKYPVNNLAPNSADFNKNLISNKNCENEKFELTSKNQEDSYDAFFADYLGVSQNAVNHFLEKFNIDNFSNYVKDSLIPTIDRLEMQKREKFQRERQARDLIKIKIKSEESKYSYKEIKENKEPKDGLKENENENALLLDNYILIDRNSSENDLGKFKGDYVGRFSDSSIIKTYEIIGNEEN